MISARFAGVSAMTIYASIITANQVLAHVPGHGPGHNMLAPYEDFINLMKRADGTSCCHKQDGIGSVPEKMQDGAYIVTIPIGTIPNMLKTVVVEVARSKVLTVEHARAVCALEAPGSNTCVAPPFNIIWLAPGTINDKEPTVYCYWPQPQFTENKGQDAQTIIVKLGLDGFEGMSAIKPEHLNFIRSVSYQFETVPPVGQSMPTPVRQHP
jgi:hypothetical protein